MLIDTHSHLADNHFDKDRAAVLERARNSGVSAMIEIGCEPANWQKALALSRNNIGIYCALGIHPQEAKLCTGDIFRELERLAVLPEVVAIGETGFDYHYENSPRKIQQDVFEKHIELSLKTGKPLIIHCRDAYPDLIETLKKKSCRGVIHCFSGSPKEAETLLGLGFYLGIDGPVTYPKARELKDVVKNSPLERLLIETDSPYLPPQKYRGKRNEPAHATLIAEEIAIIKQTDLKRIAEITCANTVSLFGIKL